MKRWLMVAALAILSGAALYYSERQKNASRVGPQAMLNALAETQREISRVPARFARLSDEEETRIGASLAQGYSTGYGSQREPSDAAMEQYVNAVGRHVAARAVRKFDYRFYYLPNPGFVNAFALPGGHIFIGKGLLMLMDSEDELASVLGHEVEHVDHFHCNERVMIEARLRSLPLASLMALPVELFQVGYSKEQEFEADHDGAYLAVMAGYAPQGAVRMFQAFERLDRQYVTRAETPSEELSQAAIESITGYFRSHPLPWEREQQIQRWIASEQWPQRQERPLRVRVGAARDEKKTPSS